MDLTSRNRFSRRLDVLRNALSEGKGLSQLSSSQETENDQHHRAEEETPASGHSATLLDNETYASMPKPGEEVEQDVDQYDSDSNLLPSTDLLLEPDIARQETQRYHITDVAHEEKDHIEPQVGSENNPREAGISDSFFSEVAGSKESPEPAQPLAAESAIQEAEESVVDHGDFIDYEDVEQLEGGTSSASSTLQGDAAIDVIAVQHLSVPGQPIAEHQEHRSPHDVQETTAADEEVLNEFEDEKDTGGIGVPAEREKSNLADILSQDSDDKGQSPSRQSDIKREAPGNDQDASISQEPKLQPKVNANDDQFQVSAQYEDEAGSYQYDTLPEHADQTEGNTYPSDNANFNGEIGDYSPTHPLQSESSETGRNFLDDDLGRVDDLEAEDELDEADRNLANDDNNRVTQPPEAVNIGSSVFVDESGQTQEDDDEITYEDEEYDTNFPHESTKAEHNVSTSPESLKRPRSLHEEDDDDALEEDLQGRGPSFGLLDQRLQQVNGSSQVLSVSALGEIGKS